MTPAPTRGPLPTWLVIGITVCLAALVGWVDFTADEVQPAVLMLVVFAASLSYLDPSRAWLVALILGLSILGTHFVARTAGLIPPSDSAVPTLLALIPAAIGAAIGAAARVMSSRSLRS